jgi:hypothetical protein
MKKFTSISEARRDYEKKQAERVEIEKPQHVERYDDKLKKYKTPPPPSAGKKY